MSSLTKFVKDVCVQPLVYWQYTGTDKYGYPAFNAPEQRYCRWDDNVEIITNDSGQQYVSEAQLLVPEDMKRQDRVILGDVNDYTGQSPDDVDGTVEVKQMERHPEFKSKTFDIFLAYL